MNELEQFGIIPVDYTTVASLLGDYKSPRDKVVRLEKSGALIRLKKGLFVVSPIIHKNVLSKELISNHLYGPSYISFESALTYYNLIPERVFSIRSMTTKRGKKFTTPLGVFDYISSKPSYYKIGIKQIVANNSYAWFVASPEKALCDMIISTSRLRIQSMKAMQEYLEEDLRIDFSVIDNLDTEIVKQCIEAGIKRTELTQLYKLLKS